MQQAIRHAESVEPTWGEKAAHILRWFIRKHPSQTFTSEQVVQWAASHGFECPTDPRSWGAVIRTAKKDGVIVRDGYGYSVARATPVPAWRGA